jgi:hypothetical protein
LNAAEFVAFEKEDVRLPNDSFQFTPAAWRYLILNLYVFLTFKPPSALVVHADEKLTAFLELERVTRS